MLDYAEVADVQPLGHAIVERALAWFRDDRRYPVAYEAGSEDFLCNGLLEAVLMRRVFRTACVDRRAASIDADFLEWWGAFVPEPTDLAAWLTPLVPSDRSDARLAHIDGLNLTRAWCWRQLLDAMPDALHAPVREAIDAHRAESLPHAARGHYVGTHWLASFALLALGVP